jgi:arabinan endo-1,5-alpha-L-arabinosidase
MPCIAGEWSLLFAPSRHGRYVNDHSVLRGPDGAWHLFGITSLVEKEFSENERYFVHASTMDLGRPMVELGKVCDNGVRAWAPAVIEHDARYYMFYGPSPTRFATSDELGHWMENTIHFHNTPLDAAHRDHFVLKVAGNRWLMYATGIHRRLCVVSVFESGDLVHWTFLRYALSTTADAPLQPAWGATESPFVVHRDGLYYLFMTYTDCTLATYHDTVVFASADPTNFGSYAGDGRGECYCTRLHAHAPEVVQDGEETFITTCGWRGWGAPIEGAVAIARLDWRQGTAAPQGIRPVS